MILTDIWSLPAHPSSGLVQYSQPTKNFQQTLVVFSLLHDPFGKMEIKSTIDIDTQRLLLAASNHDIPQLLELLKTVPATAQDPESGFTPLHAAIAACEPDEEAPISNGSNSGTGANMETEIKGEREAAAKTVQVLLENGAIWNDLDANNETPGCVARRLGLDKIYQVMVDAGVRAELLLNRLDEYALLQDDDDEGGDEDGDEDDDENIEEEIQDEQANSENIGEQSGNKNNTKDDDEEDVSKENSAYLTNPVSFTDVSLVDASYNAVMMEWERPLMEAHATHLLPRDGLRVLNIGHGMGIIDSLFQSHSPVNHHIVEAHPDVLERMKEQGWYEKPGVVIHSGSWHDILPNLVQETEDGQEIVFDAIFFDTFAEDYKALKEFFSEWVVQLLDSDGRFGFFNGMGADRQVCYDVYTKVSVLRVNLRIDIVIF
jgi:protein arginine N-methyltransferase 2